MYRLSEPKRFRTTTDTTFPSATWRNRSAGPAGRGRRRARPMGKRSGAHGAASLLRRAGEVRVAPADAPALEDRLTFIVTTSALPRHPCTAMLDAVVASLHRHCGPGAQRVRLLIVADGYAVTSSARSQWKRSRVSADQAARYEQYKAALRELAAADARPRTPLYAHAQLLEQPCHCGFALGVCRALRATTTPHVLVVQHDRPLMRDAPIGAIIDAMEAERRLEHVALPTGAPPRPAELRAVPRATRTSTCPPSRSHSRRGPAPRCRPHARRPVRSARADQVLDRPTRARDRPRRRAVLPTPSVLRLDARRPRRRVPPHLRQGPLLPRRLHRGYPRADAARGDP